MLLRSTSKLSKLPTDHILASTPTNTTENDVRPTALTFYDADDTIVVVNESLAERSTEEVDEENLETSFNEIASSFRHESDGSIGDLEKTSFVPKNSSGIDTDICSICYTGWYQASRKCVQCDNCDLWFHASCVGISDSQYEKISDLNSNWFCLSCSAPSEQPAPFQQPFQMGIVTQTLAGLHLANTQPEPVSLLSQTIRNFRTSSSPPCEPKLPDSENPRRTLSSAKWGILKGQEIGELVNSTYDLVVKWRRNLFQVPTGDVGQQFIEELTKTINFFTSSSALEEVALTMVYI